MTELSHICPKCQNELKRIWSATAKQTLLGMPERQ